MNTRDNSKADLLQCQLHMLCLEERLRHRRSCKMDLIEMCSDLKTNKMHVPDCIQSLIMEYVPPKNVESSQIMSVMSFCLGYIGVMLFLIFCFLCFELFCFVLLCAALYLNNIPLHSFAF